MRLIADATDPDTLEERNRRGYATWAFRRAMRYRMPDPLTNEERVRADYDLAIKRVQIRNWWRLEGRWRRYSPDCRPLANVVPFKGRKP